MDLMRSYSCEIGRYSLATATRTLAAECSANPIIQFFPEAHMRYPRSSRSAALGITAFLRSSFLIPKGISTEGVEEAAVSR